MRLGLLSGTIALAASLAVGTAQGATFSYGYSLDSLTGGGMNATDTSPVLGGDSVTYVSNVWIYTTSAWGGADRGIVRARAAVSADFVFPGYFTARPRGLASTGGVVTICGPGSTALSCIAPLAPIDIPVPNILLDSMIVNDRGSGANPGLAQATGKVTINGLVAASVTHTFTSSTRLSQAGSFGLTAGTFSLGMSVDTIASCAATGCEASADASNSLKFVKGEDAFLGLPAGYTVYAPDFNVFDNRWTDPRNVTEPPAPVPLPAGLPLLLTGVFALVCAGRARARATKARPR